MVVRSNKRGKGANRLLSAFKEGDLDWAKRAVARYGDLDRIRAEMAEHETLREREQMRPDRTRLLWDELRKYLRIKVAAFNAEMGEAFLKCKLSGNRFSISLPPCDAQTKAVQVSVIYDRKLLVLHLNHSDGPQPSGFALRPKIEHGPKDAEIWVLAGKRLLIPYMETTWEQAAEHIVECLLRL